MILSITVIKFSSSSDVKIQLEEFQELFNFVYPDKTDPKKIEDVFNTLDPELKGYLVNERDNFVMKDIE
jgi:hypothetical protein